MLNFKKRNESGQGLVEFAIVLPLFIIISLFVFDLFFFSLQKMAFDGLIHDDRYGTVAAYTATQNFSPSDNNLIPDHQAAPSEAVVTDYRYPGEPQSESIFEKLFILDKDKLTPVTTYTPITNTLKVIEIEKSQALGE